MLCAWGAFPACGKARGSGKILKKRELFAGAAV